MGRCHHYIYAVGTEHFGIVTILFNISYIEICNKTRVGKGFVLFYGELKSPPYLIIDILGDRFIRTGHLKVIHLS